MVHSSEKEVEMAKQEQNKLMDTLKSLKAQN